MCQGRVGRCDFSRLANLKDDREAGDYDALSYLDEDTARRAVREAEEFVAAVERYISGLLR